MNSLCDYLRSVCLMANHRREINGAYGIVFIFLSGKSMKILVQTRKSPRYQFEWGISAHLTISKWSQCQYCPLTARPWKTNSVFSSHFSQWDPISRFLKLIQLTISIDELWGKKVNWTERFIGRLITKLAGRLNLNGQHHSAIDGEVDSACVCVRLLWVTFRWEPKLFIDECELTWIVINWQKRRVTTGTLMTLASQSDTKSRSAQRRWWPEWTDAAALLPWRLHRWPTATITTSHRRPCRWPPPVSTATYVFHLSVFVCLSVCLFVCLFVFRFWLYSFGVSVIFEGVLLLFFLDLLVI